MIRFLRRGDLVLASLFASFLVAAAPATSQEPRPTQREAPQRERSPEPQAEKPARPAPQSPAPPKAARPIEERRAIAQDAARFEAKYRSAVARVDRLMEVYKEKGDAEKVLQLERLRDRLAIRREHALEGFRRDLGEDGFQRVRGQLEGGGRRGLEERAKKAKPPGASGDGR